MSFKASCSLGLALVFYTLTSFAADIPQIDVEAQEFNADECISQNADNCINDECLTSEERDCQDQCRTKAQAVCAQQSAE